MKISPLIVLSLFSCTLFAYHLPKWQIRDPVDLTWKVDEKSIFWPGVKSFFYTRKVAQFDALDKWYAMNEFCMGEHGGTHLDAPYHFYKYGWKVGDIPLQRLLAHAVVIDMSEIVNRLGPTTLLQETDLIDWERIYGPLPNHCVVIIRFGWSERYKNRQSYLGVNGTNMIFPGIAADAAQWLANSKKVVGVGVDTASVDCGSSVKFETHRILSEHNIYGIENLNLPDNLPARGFNIIVMPLKLKDGTGAPTRVLAVPELPMSADEICGNFDYSANSVPWYGHTSVVLSSLLLLGMYAINCFTL